MSASRPFPQIRGSLTISSGAYRFSVEGQPERLVLRVGSMATLMQLRKSLARLLPQVPPVRVEVTDLPTTIVALGSRPIAEVISHRGNFKIKLTPLKALFSRV